MLQRCRYEKVCLGDLAEVEWIGLSDLFDVEINERINGR